MLTYVLVWLRLAGFDFVAVSVSRVVIMKTKLAVRDLQVTWSSEAGISSGYKQDEGLKENLGINPL